MEGAGDFMLDIQSRRSAVRMMVVIDTVGGLVERRIRHCQTQQSIALPLLVDIRSTANAIPANVSSLVLT